MSDIVRKEYYTIVRTMVPEEWNNGEVYHLGGEFNTYQDAQRCVDKYSIGVRNLALKGNILALDEDFTIMHHIVTPMQTVKVRPREEREKGGGS
jgi:hypothetical protein